MTQLMEDFLKRRGRFLRIMKTCEDSLRKLDQRCPHRWAYSSDPSGNNDSGWFCDVCCACSKRKPEGA